MYNDSIKVQNKIIPFNNICEVLKKMDEQLNNYKKVYIIEEQKNKMLESEYQKWTFKDNNSQFKINISYYNETTKTFDNYNDFFNEINDKINEIKKIDSEIKLHYETDSPKKPRETFIQSIKLDIKENEMTIFYNINNQDNKLEDINNIIKEKILSIPNKEDEITKNKKTISLIISLGKGLIIGSIISLIPLIFDKSRQIFFSYYIVYPILSIIISLIIGKIISEKKLKNYYETISLDKTISEVLIGSNTDNLNNRTIIMNEYNKYKKLLTKQLIGLIIVSIIIIIVGILI